MWRSTSGLAALVPAALGLALAATAAAGCDTSAHPAPAAAGPAASPERLSREHESCGTSAHCANGLRCFEQTCRRVERSVLGDYHAALGAQAQQAGDLARALAAYGDALRAYEADGVAVPADVECAYGGALAAGKGDKDRAELAARVLHRCLGAAPPASGLRAGALRALAGLDDAGLDPAHLAREQPADVYLSRAPARPRTEDLTVAVAAAPEPRARTWPEQSAAILAARAPLVACWELHHAARGEPALVAAVPIQVVYKDSGYDDEPGSWLVQVDPKAAGPASDAERCVRDAVVAAVKSVKAGGAWTATLTITVK